MESKNFSTFFQKSISLFTPLFFRNYNWNCCKRRRSVKGSLSCFFVACVLSCAFSTLNGSIVRSRSDDKREAHLLNGLFRKGTVNTVHILRQLIVVVNPRKGKSTAILLSHFVQYVHYTFIDTTFRTTFVFLTLSLVLQQVLPLNPPLSLLPFFTSVAQYNAFIDGLADGGQ